MSLGVEDLINRLDRLNGSSVVFEQEVEVLRAKLLEKERLLKEIERRKLETQVEIDKKVNLFTKYSKQGDWKI